MQVHAMLDLSLPNWLLVIYAANDMQDVTAMKHTATESY
jgi:hypothetical protein